VIGVRVAAVVLLLSGCAALRAPFDDDAFRPRASSDKPTEHPADAGPDARFTYLLLKLDERRLYLYIGDGDPSTPADVESFPVAIGRKEYPTPTGHYKVRNKIVNPDFVVFDWKNPSHEVRTIPPGPDNPLGLRWIGFAQAHGWEIGFHGTPHPEVLGRAVSHGCVRMRNADIVRLYDRVRIGTPVIVEP